MAPQQVSDDNWDLEWNWCCCDGCCRWVRDGLSQVCKSLRLGDARFFQLRSRLWWVWLCRRWKGQEVVRVLTQESLQMQVKVPFCCNPLFPQLSCVIVVVEIVNVVVVVVVLPSSSTVTERRGRFVWWESQQLVITKKLSESDDVGNQCVSGVL
ncbi:hypothetical protein B0T13DRAFT_149922 [Neurospora crassa]|nr:hypothetical protein B0T13DRAFT_149922 [Neurospora crassa]